MNYLITSFILLLSTVSPALAQTCTSESDGHCVDLAAVANAQVPGLEFLQIDTGASLGDLLSTLYVFVLSLVGISALVMILIGGIMYMVQGDKDPTQAKAMIKNAIFGLVLALTSWLILYTINPDLVKKLDIGLEKIEYTSKSDDLTESSRTHAWLYLCDTPEICEQVAASCTNPDVITGISNCEDFGAGWHSVGRGTCTTKFKVPDQVGFDSCPGLGFLGGAYLCCTNQ